MSDSPLDQANIVLVGMPGVGKSTTGVLLAERTCHEFVDTDLAMQRRHHRSLGQLMLAEGADVFVNMEEDCVLAMQNRCCVIATGASVIYSGRAMQHLSDSGLIVHLDLGVPEIAARLAENFMDAVVRKPGQNLVSLYKERAPMYQDWADLTVNCSGLDHASVVSRVLEGLEKVVAGAAENH